MEKKPRKPETKPRTLKKKLVVHKWYRIKPFEKLQDKMFEEEYKEYVKTKKSQISWVKYIESKRLDQRVRYDLEKNATKKTKRLINKYKDKFIEDAAAIYEQEDYYLNKEIDESERKKISEDFYVEYDIIDILYKVSELGFVEKYKHYFSLEGMKFYVLNFEEIEENKWKAEFKKVKDIKIGVGRIRDNRIVAVNLNKNIFTEKDMMPTRVAFGR